MKTQAAIAILLALAGAQCLKAQMTAEIDVERTVVPRLTLQAPLPSVVPATIPASERPIHLSMSEYNGPEADFVSKPGALIAPSYTGLSDRSPYRGYAWGGYFPAYKLGLGAGYRLVDNGRTSLGAALQFDGSTYKARLPEGIRKSVNNNTFGIQADMSHRLSQQLRVGALLRYSHAALSAPTLQTLRQDQSINDFSFGLGLDGSRRRFGYRVKAGIDRFALSKAIHAGSGTLDPAAETIFRLSAGIGGFTADSTLTYGLEASINARHRTGQYLAGVVFEPVEHTGTFIASVLPNIGFRLGRTAVELGAEIDISTGMHTASFHIAPVAGIVWTPTSRFAAYARTKGGVRATDLSAIYAYSPFAPGVLSYDATFSPVDFRGGITIGSAAGFTAEIYARYASTRRAPMLAVAGTETPLGLLAPANIDGFGAGLQLGWSNRFASLGGTLEIRTRGVSKGFADAPDHAAVTATVEAHLRPADRLAIDLGWNFRGRRAYAVSDMLEPMRNISALSLGGAYTLNDRTTVFLRFENMLGRRTEILPGLTSDGFTGLAGLTFAF